MKQPNQLFYGDNLEILRNKIKDESVDLCYIDPPFNSNRKYNQIYNNIGGEDKAQAQAFTDTWKWDDRAIDGLDEIERNKGRRFSLKTIQLIKGLKNVLGESALMAYLISLTLRAVEIYRVLKPHGSFYLHCDPTASHYLKIILDSVFCANKGEFINEIAWCYSIGGRSKNNFGEKHDIIFWYSKTQDWVFNSNDPLVRINRKPNSHMKVETDEDGVVWQVKKDKKSGTIYKYPFDKVANDYWIDIEQLNREDAERLHYPTQKPEELLERIIAASSNEGDTILDAYCGCGTSIAVAENLKRNWIGIDITYQSISLVLKRLKDAFPALDINKQISLDGIPRDYASAVALAHKEDDRVRKEFEKWCVLAYSDNKAFINEKKGGDGGIDGKALMLDYNEDGAVISKDVLFSVKSEKVITPQRLREFFGTIQRDKAAMGYFISLTKPNANIYAEAKKYGKYHNSLSNMEYPVVQIITAQDIVDGNRITIPLSHQIAVVKSAKAKVKPNQHKLL